MHDRIKVGLLIGLTLSGGVLVGCQSNPQQTEQTQQIPVAPLWVYKSTELLGPLTVRISETAPWGAEAEKKRQRLIEQAVTSLTNHYQNRVREEQVKQDALRVKNQSELERKVRQKVRHGLPQWQVPRSAITIETYTDELTQTFYVLARLDVEKVRPALLKQRAQLDQALLRYVHVSEKGSNLKQLIALMPVVKIIEQIRQIDLHLSILETSLPTLKNAKLVKAYEAHLINLFDDFSVSMEALDMNSEAYDLTLMTALQKQGLKIGAMMPDLSIRYYLEVAPQGKAKGSQFVSVRVVGDYEMVNELGKRFAVINLTTEGKAETEKQAAIEAIVLQSQPIMEKLLTRIVEANDL